MRWLVLPVRKGTVWEMRPTWGAALVVWLRSFQKVDARVQAWLELCVCGRESTGGDFSSERGSRCIGAGYEVTLRITEGRGVKVRETNTAF